ncbi:MAG: hypothetical protein KAU21_21370, partial [Gammaproteobacteria bacterium]|nr:hypothetical protein [Gammaproteobacteria bacterium]
MSTRSFFYNLFSDAINMSKAVNKTAINLLFMSSLSILVSACGGGGSSGGDEPGTTNLSGTAATGAPIAGQVVVHGIGGKKESIQIDASGHYEIDVTELQAPYIIMAIPSDMSLPWQYSFAGAAGVANITPLTTLSLFIANNEASLDVLQDNWADEYNSLSQQGINDAQAIIRTNFSALIVESGLDSSLDFFTLVFNADGAGLDGLLDALGIEIDMAQGSFVITVNGAPFAFSMNGDTGDTGD